MKRFILMSVTAACLAGCHHLGDQEAYTVIDEEDVVVQQPEPVIEQPVLVQQPVYQPVYQPQPVVTQPNPNCVQTQQPTFNALGGCQVTPVSVQPQMIRIPEQSICIR